MKRIITIIAIFSIVLSVKAQNETVNGNLNVNGTVTSESRVEIKADNGSGHVASRLFLRSHNNYRGAGVFSLGQTNNWFMGNPYSDHANSFMIGVAPNSTGNEATAQKQYAKFFVNSNGNVGIGTTSPDEKLHIENSNNVNLRIHTTSPNKYAGIKLTAPRQSSGTSSHYIRTEGSNNYNLAVNADEKMFLMTNSVNRLTIGSSGNIGIGTDSPTHMFEVKNGSSDSFKTYKYGVEQITTTTGGWARSFRFSNENTNTAASFGSLNGTAYISTGFDATANNDTGFQNQKLTIRTNGNVGIGTTNPGSWKLAVNGNIRAKEIKVETGWSDFVFYDDYKLPTLTEVENHIKEKGHLKNIPSAKDVAENGILLGEMDAKLLQKIEELTLYTIAQEKKIEKLEEQTKEISELKLLVKELLAAKK